MSRKPRYPEPTPEIVRDGQYIISTLQEYAIGKKPVTRDVVRVQLNPLINAAERGAQVGDETISPLRHFPYFKPHIDAAARQANGELLACLTLALVLIGQFERHIPEYVKLIRSKQENARTSAKKRREEEKNTGTLIEAWERQNNRPLTPKSSKTDIANCAQKIERKQTTVYGELCRRERERKKH